MRASPSSVFLNVPFDKGYEPFFLSLIAAVVAVGRTPRSVVEIPELGAGRVARLLQHIAACDVSIHDLSRVGVPVRFNMPFELGLACSAAHNGENHAYVLLERKPHRLDRTLSDIKGRDPYVYGRSPRRLIGCVLDALRRDDNRSPDPRAVQAVADELTVECRRIKRKFYSSHPFTGSIFRELVLTSTVFATDIGLLEVKGSRARAV